MQYIQKTLIALLAIGFLVTSSLASVVFQEGFGRASGSPLNGSTPNLANPFGLSWNAESNDVYNYASGVVSLDYNTRWSVIHSPTVPSRGVLATATDYAALNTTARIDSVTFENGYSYYLWSRVRTFSQPESSTPHTAAIGFSVLNSNGKYHPMSASGGGIGYIYLDSLGNIVPRISQGNSAGLSATTGTANNTNTRYNALISIKVTVSNNQLSFEYYVGSWQVDQWENSVFSVPADASWFDPRFSWTSLGTAVSAIPLERMTAVTVGSALDIYSAGTWPWWMNLSLEKFSNIEPSCSIERINANQVAITYSGILHESTDCLEWSKIEPQPVSPYVISTATIQRRFFRASRE